MKVTVASSASVLDLRELYEAENPPPPPNFLKLCQGPNVLLDEMPVARLDTDEPIFAVVVRETRPEILMQAAGTYYGFEEMLNEAGKGCSDATAALTLGPMPSILQVLEELAGEPTEVERLKASSKEGLLEFSGPDGCMLVPSLSLAPLLKHIGEKTVKSLTIKVGVNSNASNQGLGVILAASPLLDPTVAEDGLPWYVYNSYGVSRDKRSNAIKFHPGMRGGQLRIEGRGGFYNSDTGFTPLNWSESGEKLHMFEITVGADGENRLRMTGTEGQEWTKDWKHQLFDGRNAPSVHAWLDMGSRSNHPVITSPISVDVHFE